jgi:DNA-binding CsgD family transcriptional regulator/tetratricopeptide (TPR) repeat protein
MAVMAVEDPLGEGRAALAEGRWEAARDAFQEALRRGQSAEALDGLGEALWWLGEPGRSLELREQAYARFRRAGDRPRAIAAALGVAVTYEANFDNRAAASGWLGRAGRLLRGEDDPLAGWVWMTAAYVSADPAEAVRLCQRALDVARAQGDADLELCSLSGLGEKLVMAGQIERGLALIDEAMAGTLGGERSRLDTVAYTCCDMLVACDLAADLERARQWCQVADRFIAAYGCPFLYARCRTLYGSVLVATGHWAAGERELLRAVEMGAGAGPAVASDAAARLADLRLRQGRLEEAALLLRGREEEPRASVVVAALRLAQGDPPGATALLRRHLRQVADGHLAAAPALALLVRAGLAQGDPAQARLAAGRLSALAAGQRSPYTAALAAEAEGQVSLAAGDPGGLERLESALAGFATLGMPYEAARARLDLAGVLAGARPEAAVAEATAALEAFARLGPGPGADAAAALLRRLGAPPRAPRGDGREDGSDLTRRERQVLRLVCLGLSNPEIAARLHISRKTAAHHVSHVLSKLGARNRVEAVALSGALSDAQGDEAPGADG